MTQQVTQGIKVSIKTRFEDAFVSNGKQQYAFSYIIRIENKSKDVVQLKSRHWKIKDALNDIDMVFGEGVVGKKPVIKPGGFHTYSSGCILLSPFGAMSGLQGIKPEGGIIGNVFDEPAALLAAAIRGAGVPVIARAVGACFTGALEVALHCDFVYTTDASKFGDTHTKFGLRPTWGMSQTLSRAVGHRRARTP